MCVCVPGPQPAGCTTPGSGVAVGAADVRGVRSGGMLCCAHDIGWLPEADGVLVQLPDSLYVGEPVPEKPPKVWLGGPQSRGRVGQ